MAQAFRAYDYWTISDKTSGEYLCREGDHANAIWLILDGLVEICSEGKHIRFRQSGELIGEQAFLRSLNGGSATRKADMIARGNVKLACIDAAFHEHLNPEQRTLWFQTLAILVNEKLEQATEGRATLQGFVDQRDRLLERFAEDDALGLVKRAVDDDAGGLVQDREAIVWFSDIAGFSSWSKQQSPEEAARIIRTITGLQIDRVRGFFGLVDKLMGDGLMAFWFLDSPDRRKRNPPAALECAKSVVAKVREFLADQELTEQLDIRIGLHCGRAAFGDFGAGNRIAVTLIGSTVNTAARYEQVKGEHFGRIRISPELRSLILGSDSPNIVSEFRGPINAGVKEGEIAVFSV